MTTTKYQRVRAKGGHKGHIKPVGEWTALCGYTPSAPKAFLMKDRSGWWKIPATHSAVTVYPCTKCKERLPEGAEFEE